MREYDDGDGTRDLDGKSSNESREGSEPSTSGTTKLNRKRTRRRREGRTEEEEVGRSEAERKMDARREREDGI